MVDISTVLPGSPNPRSWCLFEAWMAEVGRASPDISLQRLLYFLALTRPVAAAPQSYIIKLCSKLSLYIFIEYSTKVL